MTLRDAACIYTTYILQQVIDKVVDPFMAAEQLWDVSIAVNGAVSASSDELQVENQSVFHKLDPFIYCASEVRSRPSDQAFFRQAIFNAAQARLDQQEAP